MAHADLNHLYSRSQGNGQNHYLQSDTLDDVDSSPLMVKPAHSAGTNQHHTKLARVFEEPPVFRRQSSFRIDHKVTRYEQMCGQFNSMVIANVDTDPIGSYYDRLNSFHTWPNWACVTPSDVALAGMRYLGKEDKVQCDFCRGILYSWDDNDSPLFQHQKHFSECQFLKGRTWETVQRHLTEKLQKQSQKLCSANCVVSEGYLDTLEKDNKPIRSLDTVINIVTEMGYSESIINKAIKKLLKTLNIDQIDTSVLLDCIFELESESSSSDCEGDLSSNLSSSDIAVCKDNIRSASENLHLPKVDKRSFANGVVDCINCPTAKAANTLYTKEKLTQKYNTDHQMTVNNMESKIRETFHDTHSLKGKVINNHMENSCGFSHEKDTHAACQNPSLSSKKPMKQHNSKRICDESINSHIKPQHIQNSMQQDSSTEKKSPIKPQNPHHSNRLYDDLDADCDSDSSINEKAKVTPCDVTKSSRHKSANKDHVNIDKIEHDLMSVKPKKIAVEDNTKINKLIEQRDTLQKTVVCNVCNCKKIELLFLPCRHMVACEECGSRLDNCLTCSRTVVATVRVYLI